MFRAFVIRGESMYPLLSTGDVVFTTIVPRSCIRIGMICVVEPEPDFVVCKRIVETLPDLQFVLSSDNAEVPSIYESSIHDFSKLLGVMLFRLPKWMCR